jgi:serine phosphatase RsbU (regulator of sigma subunit)
MYLAGHPSPLLLSGDEVLELAAEARGPLLGVFEDSKWPANRVDLGTEWTLVLFTDGIVEGRAGNGEGEGERFKTTGLARLAHQALEETRDLESLADQLIVGAERANGAPLRDDVALLLLSTSKHWLP